MNNKYNKSIRKYQEKINILKVVTMYDLYIRKMHNINTLVNTLTYRFTNGTNLYTIIDPFMCYDELVIKLNEIFNKFCPISCPKLIIKKLSIEYVIKDYGAPLQMAAYHKKL